MSRLIASPIRRSPILVCLVLLLCASVVRAQETTTGSLGGRVIDAQGLGVPGASLTITSDQGTRSVTTDEDGRFFVPFLTPGTYTVRGELAGFQPIERSNVAVRLGQCAELTLPIQLSGVTEAVQVQASRAVVDVTGTTVGANLDAETRGCRDGRRQPCSLS